MTALSFDTTSPANPYEYQHKAYVAVNHRPWAWATYLPHVIILVTHVKFGKT